MYINTNLASYLLLPLRDRYIVYTQADDQYLKVTVAR